MKAKDKAKELVNKYLIIEIQIKGKYDGYLSMQIHDAKQCALIAVDEILDTKAIYYDYTQYDYWIEVKQEIINL